MKTEDNKRQLRIPILNLEKETDLVLLVDTSGKNVEYAVRYQKEKASKNEYQEEK